MKFIIPPVLSPAPNATTPLAGIISFETDQPAFAEIRIDDGAYVRVSKSAATVHRHPVLGLKPDAGHRVTIRAIGETGDMIEVAEGLEIHTPPLPDDFPPLKIETCITERREPGFTVFPCGYAPMMPGPEKPCYLIAIDRDGDVVWHHRETLPIHGMARLANGNLAYLPDTYILTEIDMLGNVQHKWYPTGRYKDGVPGGAPVETEIIHHGICAMDSGNILALSIETREFADWPGGDEDPDAPRGPAKVVGDVVIEFQPDGKIVNQWKLLDLLDPQRISHGSFAKFWANKGYPDTCDWSHANSVTYDPSDDSVIVSCRHQDAIIKISRKTGELVWIMGDPANWNAPWSDLLLTPEAGMEWAYHQHDLSITRDGGLLLFDNGNNKAVPFETRTPAAENYSRAVVFKIDAAAMTVSQPWCFDAGRDPQYYSMFVSGADQLPETGNVFVTFGGISHGDDGAPSDNNQTGRIRTRLVEVTGDAAPQKIFEMSIQDASASDPIKWFSFRSEHLAGLYP